MVVVERGGAFDKDVPVKRIIILGTGGNCVDILDTLNDINAARGQTMFHCIGFLDDNRKIIGSEVCGVQVLGPLDSAAAHSDCCFVNGIGNPFNFWKKREIIARTEIPDDRFETIIHPSASISRTAQFGFGTVVFQNATVTSRVRVGNHVMILPNTVVSHDSVIGDYTCLAGGVCVSGGVRIGHSCYLGTNCSIIGNVAVGADCLVGMGSAVLDDVPDNTVVAGNPARQIRKTISPAG